MSIRTWWKERSKEIARVRKVRFVGNLYQKLDAINAEDNEGRLSALVYNLPEVRKMSMFYLDPDTAPSTLECPGCGYEFVRITMSDHYTINAYELFLTDALKDAAIQVVDRLLEKRGIPLRSTDNE